MVHCHLSNFTSVAIRQPEFLLVATAESAQMRGLATGVDSKADIGGPITRDISAGGAGLSTSARSSSLGPTHLAGGFPPTRRIACPISTGHYQRSLVSGGRGAGAASRRSRWRAGQVASRMAMAPILEGKRGFVETRPALRRSDPGASRPGPARRRRAIL